MTPLHLSPDLRACLSPEIAHMIDLFGWRISASRLSTEGMVWQPLPGEYAVTICIASHPSAARRDTYAIRAGGPLLDPATSVYVTGCDADDGAGHIEIEEEIPLAYALARYGSPLRHHHLAALILAEERRALPSRQYVRATPNPEGWDDAATFADLFQRAYGREWVLAVDGMDDIETTDARAVDSATRLAEEWRRLSVDLTDEAILDDLKGVSDLNVACRAIRYRLGVTDGGLADGIDDEAWEYLDDYQRRGVLAAHIAAERWAAEQEAKPPKPARIGIRCATCGSTDVKRDAFAEWDSEAQEWVLGAKFDQSYCAACGREASLEQFPLDDPTITTYPLPPASLRG